MIIQQLYQELDGYQPLETGKLISSLPGVRVRKTAPFALNRTTIHTANPVE